MPGAIDTIKVVPFEFEGINFLCAVERERSGTYHALVAYQVIGSREDRLLPRETVPHPTEAQALRSAEQQAMRWAAARQAADAQPMSWA